MALVTQRKPYKVEKFGLEVPNRVTYQSWEPGGEYTKTIVLKNVKVKTQKIKFKVSSNIFFSAVYPQPIVLSAGNSYSLPITFRPLEKSQYKEIVEFETSDGQFSVPLYALLPQPQFSIPETVQFGMCAVEGTQTMEVTITNAGSVSTDFHWECSPPFEITPVMGTLDPKENCKLKVSFAPHLASVYQVKAICHYGEKYNRNKIMKLEGTGKYPHLIIKQAITLNGEVTVKFGEVPVGTTAERTLEIFNTTPVPASFSIQPETEVQVKDVLFTFSQSEGTIAPMGTLFNKIYYSPNYTEPTSTVHYILSTKGGLATTRLICTGCPLGPKVSIVEQCLNFGSVECGRTTTALLHIKNASKASTIYQFQLDSYGVFYTENPSGELSSEDESIVTIYFSPTKPIPYHRIVTCLILNQEPITVHFIGSAYNELIKPAQLTPNHISLYKSVSYSGLSRFQPEYLQECVANGSLNIDDNGALVPTELFQLPLHELAPSIEGQALISNYARYFKRENELFEPYHVSIDQEYLEFGYIASYKSSEGKVVTVTNHTQGTVCCAWITGRVEVFKVVPAEREIPANTTVAFSVSFRPDKPNQLFSQQLECYIFYKVLKDYSQVKSHLIIPPWCLLVTVLGHSFPPDVEPFLPTLAFNTHNVVFASTRQKQSVYRNIVAKNCGETPIMYRFTPDPLNIFKIKPECGLLSDTYQLFVLEMSPKNSQLYQHILDCIINNCPDFKQEILLSGIAETPKLQINYKGGIYFKPTAVGGSSDVHYTITNPCGLPLKFLWQLKGSDTNVIVITPSSGTLAPYETVGVIAKFIPHEQKRYSFKSIITSVFDGQYVEGSAQRNKIALRLFGEGTSGKITCTVSQLDCSPVVIGTSLRTSVTLENNSNCSLKFKLGVKQVIELDDGTKEEVSIEKKPRGLELNLTEIELDAHSKQTLYLTIRPSQPATIQSDIHYQLVFPEHLNTTAQWQSLCIVNAKAAYPSLSVVDVQSDGMAGSLSKSQIWRMLQINRLNQYLCQDPSPTELRYAISTRHSVTRKVPVLTRAVLDFNFGAAPIDKDKKSTFYLLLSNASLVPCQWAFQFPMDMYLEPEYWADTGQINSVEQHELDVVNNRLFSVQPKQGHLNVGERVIVECSYKHSHLGTSQLPVLLKINRGREIMLNFTGLTSPLHTPCISMASHTHHFAPVPIGTQSYPIQLFELYNNGDTAGTYSIDTTPLEDMTKSNYNLCVLKCLQSEGDLLPGQTTDIPFIFSPTEAKLYSVELPVHFSTNEVIIVTFLGEGIIADDKIMLESGSDSQNIPEHSVLVLPDQLAEQSQERLDLGHIPLFAVIRQLIFLRNPSQYTLSYQWQLNGEQAQQVLSINPSSGYLKPEQSTACRITFHSLKSPAIYDMNISCKITNESEMTVYKDKLKIWEREEEERKQGFTITDRKTISKKEYKTSGETYEEWQKMDLSVKSKNRTRQRRSQQMKAPQPPLPQYLYLGVTAQTHAIPDYCQLFNDFDKYTIDYQSLLLGTTPVTKEKKKETVMVKEKEKVMVDIIMAQMLRELLSDTNFQKSLHCVAEEPVPYFTQFSTQPTATNESTQDNATRHIYASGLEGIPSVVESIGHESLQSSQNQSEDNIATGDSESSIGLPEPPPPLSSLSASDKVGNKIKNLPEFHSLVETVTENILLNIIRESLVGEVDLSAPLFTIAKPYNS